MNDAANVTPVPVTFFPDYRATNPYQTLLYENLGPAFKAEPGTIEDALALQKASPGKPLLFHLHWEHAVFTGSGEPQVVDRFLDDISRFRSAGGKVIWSIHNLRPHDGHKSNANYDLQSGLSKMADVLHLHSLPAVAAARDELDLPERKIRVISHHNYEGAYPVFPRKAARAELGLSGARMVVLCPGRVAPYKQPHELVSEFLKAASPEDRLIIAGETARNFDFNLPSDARLIHREGFATPEEVGRLHAAADFVVLPYRASLTSGSAILAATLGRAVIGQDTPGLRDVVAPPSTGIIYQNGDLADALHNALDEEAETWAERGKAAAGLARARNQIAIAAAWRDVMNSLVRKDYSRLGGP
ncbi:glycosyltransferase [Roseibium album]|uniref:glycosyltransferase n=1 Tax=Roseibium album TaxID=311410 RepID=UPI003918A349